MKIVTARRDNCITIPPEAVKLTAAQPFVWMQDSRGKPKKQPITLGLQGLQKVEVTSGLQAGDKLVIAPLDVPLTPETPLIAK